MLRIDSIEFIACALSIVIAMRTLPIEMARVFYAGLSVATYCWLMPDLASLALSLFFLYWPWVLLVRRSTVSSPWAVPTVICVQTALFVWSRKYLLLIPALAGSPVVSHTLVIIGVSYVILRQVELVLWVDAEPETELGFWNYSAFAIGLFTLLAGPIVTYRNFKRGFGNRQPQDLLQVARLLNRIVNGYIKVSLLGPLFYQLSSMAHLDQREQTTGAWLAFFYLYPLYIYLNFSGYCDVVIAAAKLSHIDLPENFNHPFLATNIQSYWQRWHITFSTWIRAHVFFPLMRLLRGWGAWGTPLALILTFIIVGLWHGTDPCFAVFGVLHGLAVLAVTPYQALLRRVLGERALAVYETNRVIRGVRILFCYHYLCFTMLFFERPFAKMWELLT